MTPRLKKCYIEEVVPKLMQISEFGYKNKYQVPYIKKVVINRGLGDASQNEQILKSSLSLKFIKTIYISFIIDLNKYEISKKSSVSNLKKI